MTDVFLQVLNMSLTGSVVILLVMAARLALKRMPKIYAYALWAVVLFRLLCPVSLSAPVSALSVMRPAVSVSTAAASTVSYLPTAAVLPVDTTAAQTAMEGEQAEATGKNEGNARDLWTLLSWAWLAGGAAMAGYSLLQYLRLRNRLLGAACQNGIYLADHIDTPFVMGLLRPRVYLPSGIGEREREFILAHERQHIRRGDPLWKLLGFLALCIHWFNPLAWAAFVLAGKDMEMSCDEAVIRQLGPKVRADYSAALLRLSSGRGTVAGMPLAFGEGDTKGRVRNMARWKKPSRWVCLGCAVLCLVILTLCGLNPRGTKALSGVPISGPADVPFGRMWFRLPEGFYYEPQDGENTGGLITNGTDAVGGVMVFPLPESIDGWDWMYQLPLEEWKDGSLGSYADGAAGGEYNLEFFSDVPEGVERTVLRMHRLYIQPDGIYDLWLDELKVEGTTRESVWNSVAFGSDAPKASLSLPYEIGPLPDGFSCITETGGIIHICRDGQIVGGITAYRIPEGVYDPYDRHFEWLERVGIPDYSDPTMEFTGGITGSDGGWNVTFASVPEAEPAAIRTHRFHPSGEFVYDFWLDETKMDIGTQFALADAIRCVAPPMEPETAQTKEELAFAQCRAVMDAARADSCQLLSEYRFENDAGKNYTVEDYDHPELGFLCVPHPADGDRDAMLYAYDRVFTGTEENGLLRWKEQAGFERTVPWLSGFELIKRYVTYIDTLENETGKSCVFLVNAPFSEEAGAAQDYLAEFFFDAQGSFVKVQLHINSFQEDAFILTQSIVTLDADQIASRIQAEYQSAIA